MDSEWRFAAAQHTLEFFPILTIVLAQDAGASEEVEFDWYLAVAEQSSASNALNMVCRGGFDINAIAPLANLTQVE